MHHIKNLFFIGLLLISFQCFGQWTEISNIGDHIIKTLNFQDDFLGYVLMNNDAGDDPGIMKTIDGGESWIELSLPGFTGEYQDIYFYDNGTGVLLIRNLEDEIAPTKIFRTLNDGTNWEDISPNATATGVGVGQCQFLNQSTGFFATDKFLYSTTDGGENWTSKPFSDYILSIDFLDEMHGVMGTWDGTFSYKGGMLTTVDGGQSWKNYLLDDNYTSIVEVRQINTGLAIAAPVHSWASIQAGEFYKTIDSGETWTAIEIPKQENDYTLRQIDFRNEMFGVICVGNTISTSIYKTNDGGQTWKWEDEISSTYESDLQLTATAGYISGEKGSFYKRLDSVSAKEEPIQADIKLFPSPIKHGQTIHWETIEKFNYITILDQTGRVLHSEQLRNNQLTLPQIPPGFYIIQLWSKKNLATTKLMVE